MPRQKGANSFLLFFPFISFRLRNYRKTLRCDGAATETQLAFVAERQGLRASSSQSPHFRRRKGFVATISNQELRSEQFPERLLRDANPSQLRGQAADLKLHHHHRDQRQSDDGDRRHGKRSHLGAMQALHLLLRPAGPPIRPLPLPFVSLRPVQFHCMQFLPPSGHGRLRNTLILSTPLTSVLTERLGYDTVKRDCFVGICGNDRTSCYYLVSYGDGSYTRGVLAQERISLGETNVENFIFGCGRSNRGLFGGTSGLMGLGRTELSLISQTASQFGGVFSYCLPSMPFNSSGSLVLGSDLSVYRNSTPISYTRMISDSEQQPFYFLNLTGLRVGAVELQAPGFSNGKVLIDSGTVITRLAPSVYKALKDEFVRQFAAYPTAPGFSILDTCFNLSGYEEVKVPTLRLGFEGGVQLNVDVTGIFYFVKRDASQACLAFASLSYEDQSGIIGNYQQKNQRVVYDTIGSKLGFAQEECSYS